MKNANKHPRTNPKKTKHRWKVTSDNGKFRRPDLRKIQKDDFRSKGESK